MSKVYLFTGVETFDWQLSNFQEAVDFCLAHRVDGLIVKFYEITQGPWYQSVGAQKVYDLIQNAGLDCLPYGFFYGVSPEEIQFALGALEHFGKFCCNCEGTWDNNSTFASTFAHAMAGHPGELWMSTWANPVDHHWTENIKIMDSVVDVWMPEEYGDQNVTRRLAQFPLVRGNIFPTYAIGNNTISLTSITDNPSLWEWQDAVKFPQWVDDFVTHQKGSTPVTTTTKVKLNAQGCVCETAFWYQLSENEMDTCGPTSAAMIAKSVAPNTKLSATTEDIDVMTDAIILDVFGISDPKQFQGVDTWDHDMTNIMNYLAKKLGNVHFKVVSTMEQLEAGIRSGYLGLYGCNELDLFQWNNTEGWVHPYAWRLSAGHILGLVGLDTNGNWITADPLNNAVHIPIYRRSAIANSFSGGMIVQITDWLAPIPDIHNWPANFNAQQTGVTPPMPTLNDNQLKAFKAEVLSIVPSLSFSSRIMGQVMSDYAAGKFRGPALCMEYLTTDWSVQGHPITAMCFAGGRYEDDGTTIRYYPYS